MRTEQEIKGISRLTEGIAQELESEVGEAVLRRTLTEMRETGPHSLYDIWMQARGMVSDLRGTP